jgi:hypothetical protein
MATISRKFFATIEQQIAGFSDAKSRSLPPNAPLLHTNFDESASAKKVASTSKRQIGRLKKWMADLSMQLCAIGDAMELYLAAISDLRPLGDSMWLAGALEGLAAAIFIVLKLGLKIEDYLGNEIIVAAQVSSITAEIAAFRIAEERYCEAILLLSRTENCFLLAAESSVRLAHTLCFINSSDGYFAVFEDGRLSRIPSSAGPDEVNAQDNVLTEVVTYENGIFIRNYESQHERRGKVVDLILRASELPGLSDLQVIECILCGALLCRRLKMYRKYIFLVYRAATMHTERQDYSVTIPILKMLVEDVLKLSAVSVPKLWSYLLRGLLKLLAENAHQTGDLKCAGNAISKLLQLISKSLNEQGYLFPLLDVKPNVLTESHRFAPKIQATASSTSEKFSADTLSDRFTEFNSEYSFPAVLSSPLSALRKLTAQKSADEFERYDIHLLQFYYSPYTTNYFSKKKIDRGLR